MQSLDAAAEIAREHYDHDNDRLILMYAALSHDLGKPQTTGVVDGRWRSLNHEKEGAIQAKKMLKRIVLKKELIDAAAKLIESHMAPMQFIENDAGPSAYKRLADKLGTRVNIRMLADLARADKRGRNPDGAYPLKDTFEDIQTFVARAKEADVYEKREEPILQGRDIIDEVPPGAQMGELLERAYRIQIEKGITDKDELKRRVLS